MWWDGAWERDVSPADWLVERMTTFAVDLASFVPTGFEAYARVFHPLGADDERWADVAARHGRVAHADMQPHAIRDRQAYEDDAYEGSLPSDIAEVLVEHLASATSSPDRCWFCVWEGWGALHQEQVPERVVLPCRTYFLAAGPIGTAAESFGIPYHQSAAIWWPDDRAWVVATEIDFGWTYVGASAEVIASILADDRIEALSVGPTHRANHDADLINVSRS